MRTMQHPARSRQTAGFITATVIGLSLGVLLVGFWPRSLSRNHRTATASALAPRDLALASRFAVLRFPAQPLPGGLLNAPLFRSFGLWPRATRELPTDVGLTAWMVPGARGICVAGQVAGSAEGNPGCAPTRRAERNGVWAAAPGLLYGIVPQGVVSVAALGPTRAVVGDQAVRNDLVVFHGLQTAVMQKLLLRGARGATRATVTPPHFSGGNVEPPVFAVPTTTG